MGFPPREVWLMTFEEFLMARDGYLLSQGVKERSDASDDELAAAGVVGF